MGKLSQPQRKKGTGSRSILHWSLCLLPFSYFIVWGLHAQQTERPGNSLDHPIDVPRDLSGLSIKNPRIRVVHTTDPAKEGGSMYLQQVDPWLGYQWGRSLFQRNFRERDGVYGDAGKLDGITLPDGVSKMMDRGHASSCGACHNVPYRDAGAGMTIAKNGGSGRNTPHVFGGGLLEMIGMQMRLQALAIADTNRDGWISLDEAKGKRCILHTLPPGVPGEGAVVDFGSFEDLNGDGYPDLNPVFYPIFVDRSGKRIPAATSLHYPGVAGYTLQVQVFGFGHLYMPLRPPVSTTLRAFTATPFDIHAGLQACDPTTFTSRQGDGLGLVSNAGAQQFVTEALKDRGAVRGRTGISMDDPDRDGYCEEISEGDLDVVEWYLLNHPAPTRGRLTNDVLRGERLFKDLGCISCHTPDWHLFAYNPGANDYTERYDGDRRFFEIRVAYNEKTERLEGKLYSLAERKGKRWLPRRQAYTIRGVYSDFKYHDVGPEFYQMQFDGSIVRQWRTTPLWGVGTTAPYGHDGASLDLDAVIRRHGGEALPTRKAYLALEDEDRRRVVCFLQSLVLYQTDQLPCDIDEDGKISEHFLVQGMDTGLERFNPEWLFRVPGRIEGPIMNVRHEPIISYALTNVRQAYGLDLAYLKDSDGDGFPDVIDPAPFKKGFKDGEK
ncbi:MAG TPA: di-heme oxidoredictase family protein [Gemmataceae bacterium]|nr:di-heme oxidoredictase family protein [Gemmataceae bacterium]